MPRRRRRKRAGLGLLKTIRKPMAPPVRVEEDIKKYKRARERERRRRREEEPEG